MNPKLLLTIICLGIATAGTQAMEMPQGPFKSDLKLAELASLPDGLIVVHTQNTAETGPMGPTGLNVHFSTTVTSEVGPVTIEEFGCLVKEQGQWVYGTSTSEPHSDSDFAELYGCPGAELKPGEGYTDPWNTFGGFRAPGQVVRWYFIGFDAEGNRIKGEADVEFLSDLGC